jgi:hypothetical protein
VDIKSLFWDVPETVYRSDTAISYSDISQYMQIGKDIVNHFREKKSSYGLSLGTVLDCLITEGIQVFSEKYLLTDFNPENKGEQLVESIFNYIATPSLKDAVKDNGVIQMITDSSYYPNRTLESRLAALFKIEKYWNDLAKAAEDHKQIIASSLYDEATELVDKLKSNALTNNLLFAKVEEGETFNQPKLHVTISGVDFRCMIDRLIIDHLKKRIFMIDLKYTSSSLDVFLDSYVHWNYQIQTRLYRSILKEKLKGTEFSDYEIKDYIYVVVNKEDALAFSINIPDGDIIYKAESGKEYYFPDPIRLGKELDTLLKSGLQPIINTLIKPKLNTLLRGQFGLVNIKPIHL